MVNLDRLNVVRLTGFCNGGTKFRPLSYFVDNKQEYLIGAVEAFRLKSHVVGKEFKTSPTKFPMKNKELELLVNSIKEADNPVLMIVRLKK